MKTVFGILATAAILFAVFTAVARYRKQIGAAFHKSWKWITDTPLPWAKQKWNNYWAWVNNKETKILA